MSKLPVPFSVPPVTRSPATFSTGTGSPVSIDSSTALLPSITVPSIGILSPGRTRKMSPTLTSASGTVSVLPSAEHAQRGLGRKVEERADGAAGFLAGPELEHLAEQHERNDHRRRLEIGRDEPMGVAHRGREQAGRDRGDDAVEKRRAGAERDQGEHVEAAGAERRDPALEERPAAPEHRGYGDDELQPLLRLRRQEGQEVDAEDVGAHVEGEQRERERRAQPKACG